MRSFLRILILVLIFSLVFWFGLDYFGNHVVVLDRIGSLEVRWLTRVELSKKVEEYEKMKTVRVVLPGVDKKYSLEELGLSLDLGDLWFEKNRVDYLWREKTLKIKVRKNKLVVESPNKIKMEVRFETATGLFVVKSGRSDYDVDFGEIVRLVADSYGSVGMEIVPKYSLVETGGEKYHRTNEALKKVYATPLAMKVKDGGDFVDYQIPKERVIEALKVSDLEQGKIASLNRGVLLGEVEAKLSENQRRYFDGNLAYKNLEEEIKRRFETGFAQTAVLGVDDGPTSKGELAIRYLEVDISQQKMYFFINGKLFKEYRVSTGDYYPTPTGQYKILNKAKNAFSEIYGVWMPYWMAFDYAEDIGAYLGIHELPYVESNTGGRIYRFGYYIGNKMTGGCVAMEPKDSKEIYNLSSEGMLVNIVQ